MIKKKEKETERIRKMNLEKMKMMELFREKGLGKVPEGKEVEEREGVEEGVDREVDLSRQRSEGQTKTVPVDSLVMSLSNSIPSWF